MAERALRNFLCLMILAEQRCSSGAPLVLGQQWHCQVVEDNHTWRDLSFEAHQEETHNPEQPGCKGPLDAFYSIGVSRSELAAR